MMTSWSRGYDVTSVVTSWIDDFIKRRLWCYKKCGKGWSLKNKQIKIIIENFRHSFIVSVHEGIMKSVTSLTPPSTDLSTGLSIIQFSTLKILESLILKDQKNYKCIVTLCIDNRKVMMSCGNSNFFWSLHG